MRKLITAAIASLAFFGASAGTAWAAPDATGACRNYARNTEQVNRRELELEHLAAWAGVTVEEYCTAAGEPFGV